MATDPVALLKEIGKQLGKRVSSTNLFDANVRTSPWNAERPWEVSVLTGDVFRHKLDIKINGHQVKLRANSEFIAAEVTGNLALDVCSINRRDKVFQLDESHRRVPGFSSLPVYSRQSDKDLEEFLNSAALAQAVNTLHLTEHESLHFYRNGLLLYLQRGSKEEVIAAVEVGCTLAEQFPATEDSLDLSGLPAKFENLLGLIPRWALSNDEKRSEMLEETPREALESFVATVSPYLSAIDEYLDSFGGEPPPEAAASLGALAECCLEAQIQIRGNQKK